MKALERGSVAMLEVSVYDTVDWWQRECQDCSDTEAVRDYQYFPIITYLGLCRNV